MVASIAAEGVTNELLLQMIHGIQPAHDRERSQMVGFSGEPSSIFKRMTTAFTHTRGIAGGSRPLQ